MGSGYKELFSSDPARGGGALTPNVGFDTGDFVQYRRGGLLKNESVAVSNWWQPGPPPESDPHR